MNNSEHISSNMLLFGTSQNSTTLPYYFNRSFVSTRIAIYALISSIIVVGNILCLVVFLRTKALRRRSYYLLINLSVADLIVGFASVLLCIEDGLKLRGERSATLSLCRDLLLYLPRMCSLFIIATVAIERFWAVGYPIKHRQTGKLPYAALILIPWLLASFLTFLHLASKTRFDWVSLDVFKYMDVALSQLTLLAIVLFYCALLCKIKQTNSNATIRNGRNVIKERKLAATLFVVTLASLITIYPVNMYFLVEISRGRYLDIPENLFLFLRALACTNSGINIIVYLLRIAEFKKAVRKIFGPECRHNHQVSCSKEALDTRL